MIPFSPPHIDQKIIDEVVKTLRSGWITTGPRTKQFEKKLEDYIGVSKVLCLNSATAGLELMLRWFGVGPGDEVIVPAYTYCATANVVLHCGAKPVMADVGTDFNIDVSKLDTLISPNTKVIIPVDMGGLPCDYEALLELVEGVRNQFRQNSGEQEQMGRILLLADAAHSLGATYKGKQSGTLADISVLSFHAVKNLPTAEGGAVCLNLPSPFDIQEIYQALCIKSLHGQSKDALAKIEGQWEYDVIEAGYKYNMPDVLAAMGLVELERYGSEILPHRKLIFESYESAFSSLDWAQTPVFKTEHKTSAYHVYMLRLASGGSDERDAVIQRIFNKEVSVNVHFKPLPMLTVYKDLGYNINDYPVAYDNFCREISLPVYYDLGDEQVQTVIEAVSSSIDR